MLELRLRDAVASCALCLLVACASATTMPTAGHEPTAAGTKPQRGGAMTEDEVLRDDGVCASGLPDLAAAETWARSLRLVGTLPTASPEVELVTHALGAGRTEPSRSQMALEGRVIVQLIHYPPASSHFVREVVAVRHDGEVSACLVSERRAHGHPQRPTLEVTPLEVQLEHVIALELRSGSGMGGHARRHVRCQLDEQRLGCLTVPASDRHVYRDGRLQYRPAADRRAQLPMTPGQSRWLDGKLEQPLRGRSARWRTSHPGAVAPPERGAPITWLTPEQTKLSQGKVDTHGLCFSGAADWNDAEIWAQTFSVDQAERQRVSLKRDGVDGNLAGGTLRTYRQEVREGMSITVRHFAMARTAEASVTGCMVTEDALQYGYLQSPTPAAGTLKPWGEAGFSYRAEHDWNDANGDPEDATWSVYCRLDARLGCIAVATEWHRQDYDPDTRTKHRERHEPVVEWRGNTLSWIEGERNVELELAPGRSAAVGPFGVRKLQAEVR